MQNENNQAINNVKKCQSIPLNNDESLDFVKSTPIPTSIPYKNKDDSGFSSAISQRNRFIHASSPINAHTNISKVESTGTSNSSHNSFLNDDEWDEMITCSGNFLPIDRSIDSMFYLSRDLDNNTEMLPIRQSHRNSPWTNRPESAPLNEEDEDSDKEASKYSCNSAQESNPSSVQSDIRCQLNMSTGDHERRNELIASKLREIADKLSPSTIQVRTRKLSMSHDNTRRSSKRNSQSSFADIVPCGCGSVIDLILSLYSVYRMNSKSTVGTTVPSSQSMVNMNQARPRINNRCRSYTQ